MKQHNNPSFTTRIIEQIPNETERLQRETYWQDKLRTHYPHGINDTPSNLTPYIDLTLDTSDYTPDEIHSTPTLPHTQTPTQSHPPHSTAPTRPLTPTPQNVINLSKTTLTMDQTSVLNRGLKFIPTPRRLPITHINTSLLNLTRNLKLKSFFQGCKDKDFDPKLKTFEEKSDWTPSNKQVDSTTLETINEITQLTNSIIRREGLQDYIPIRDKPNLSPSEYQALKILKMNPSIIIKPADKGSAIVIMDKEAYTHEVHRQLYNRKYYHTLTHPIYPDNALKITQTLELMKRQGFISPKQFAYLLPPPEPRPRLFYLLPKIHKPIQKWTLPNMPEGRPIVSDCNSESYRIAEFLDHHIFPLSTRHPAYLKDTYHFLNRIQNQQVPTNTLLFTADVTSLYTNMDLTRTIDLVRKIFQKYPDPNRPDDSLIQLLTITLRGNDFLFNKQWFIQVIGIAMGKRYSPGLANIYLQDLDDAAMTGFHIRPGLYGRYLDDIFGTWTGTRPELFEFRDFLNTLLPNIELTFTIDEQEVNFLDTTVYKHTENGITTLRTRLYTKPTDTHQLLHTQSYHAPHTCPGVMKSQFIRYKRICSTKSEYDQACITLQRALGPRGYSDRRMRQVKREIWTNSITKKSPTAPDREILPIVIPYSQFTSKLIHHWTQIMARHSLTDHIRPIKAFSTFPNLQKSLVHTKF